MNFFPNTTPVAAQEGQPAAVSAEKKETPRQKHFAFWEVGGDSFKLKLQTAGVKELESRYKMPVMNLMQHENGTPPITVMLDVAHVAMKPWNHKITQKDMESLFDKYLESGGDMLSFYTNVYLEIFMVSGFLSQRMASDMKTSLEEMRKEL